MKKIILSFIVIASSFCGQSQVVCAGVSPAAIQGNYLFSVQTDFGWPRYTGFGGAASENWGLTLDFSIPGTFVQQELVLVDDGTSGTNTVYGNLLSEEGCNPSPLNAYTGKIAILRRNTCDFATKAKYAQDAGALAVIVVDREDNENRENNYLSASATGDGPNVTIPVVMLNKTAGDAIITEMLSGPVVMFIGNRIGGFPNDIGANEDELLISPFRFNSDYIDNGFDIGIQLYNYGSNTQNNVTVTANIDGPSGNVYNEVIVGPSMITGDTLSIFNGNTYEFPPFDLGGIGNYPAGDYTLTYTLDMGVADDLDFDNIISSTFTINTNQLSLSRIDTSGMPIANSFPMGSVKPTDYQSCMFFQDSAASNMGLSSISFVPYADTSIAEFGGAELFVNVYTWDDAWTDINDPTYFGTSATNDPFSQLNLIAYNTHYTNSNNETGDPVTVDITPFLLVDNQRYLFCIQSYDTNVVVGYDNTINYDGNQGIYAMPISPVHGKSTTGVDTWFVGGWSGVSAPSIVLNVFDAAEMGLAENSTIDVLAYPNPAKDLVTVSIASEGSADVTITDLSGKVAGNSTITLVDGKANVNIASLEDGVYIFNVTLENGLTSQFNIVKQ